MKQVKIKLDLDTSSEAQMRATSSFFWELAEAARADKAETPLGMNKSTVRETIGKTVKSPAPAVLGGPGEPTIVEAPDTAKEDAAKLEAEIKKANKVKEARIKEMAPYIQYIRDYDGLLAMTAKDYKKEFADIKRGAVEHLEDQANTDDELKKQLEEVAEITEKAEATKEEPTVKTYKLDEVRKMISPLIGNHREALTKKLRTLPMVDAKGKPSVSNLSPDSYTEFVVFMEGL